MPFLEERREIGIPLFREYFAFKRYMFRSTVVVLQVHYIIIKLSIITICYHLNVIKVKFCFMPLSIHEIYDS